MDIPDLAEAALFQGDRPAVGVPDGDIFDGKVVNFDQQNADVAPVSFGVFALPAAVSTESSGAEEFAAVSGGAGDIGADKFDFSHTFDGDIADDIRFTANDAVGGAEKVVPAAVSEFQRAVFQYDGGVSGQQQSLFQQPESTFGSGIGFAGGDDRFAAGSNGGTDSGIDPLAVAALEVIGVEVGGKGDGGKESQQQRR